MHKKVVFLLFSKNEELTIHSVISNINEIAKELNLNDHHILLVDDSEDQTAEFAKAAGAIVVSGHHNGLGSAYKIGLRSLLIYRPDIVVSMDTDGQVDIKELRIFLETFEKTQSDLVLGSRFHSTDLVKYKYPLINRIGVVFLSKYISLMVGQQISDSHGGLRVMSSAAAENMKIFGNHTYVQESIIDCKERGLKIIEIPSLWRSREFGTSKVVSSIGKYASKVFPILVWRIIYRYSRRFS